MIEILAIVILVILAILLWPLIVVLVLWASAIMLGGVVVFIASQYPLTAMTLVTLGLIYAIWDRYRHEHE